MRKRAIFGQTKYNANANTQQLRIFVKQAIRERCSCFETGFTQVGGDVCYLVTGLVRSPRKKPCAFWSLVRSLVQEPCTFPYPQVRGPLRFPVALGSGKAMSSGSGTLALSRGLGFRESLALSLSRVLGFQEPGDFPCHRVRDHRVAALRFEQSHGTSPQPLAAPATTSSYQLRGVWCGVDGVRCRGGDAGCSV